MLLVVQQTLGPRASNIKCSQINLQHCHAAAHSFYEQLASSMHTHLALIQEPYCPFARVVGVPSNLALHVGKFGARVRAAIVTSKTLGAWTLHQFSDEDMVAVGLKITNHGREELLIAASVYMPYESPDPPPTRKLQDLVDFCADRGLRLLLGCDTNAHHTQWGSTNVNNRGEALLEYILGSDLMVCNQGNQPTFVAQDRREVIDVTLATIGMQGWIKDWTVDPRETFSDHRLIVFTLECSPCRAVSKYRNVRKTDWGKYLQLLERRTADIDVSMPTTVEGVDRLCAAIEGSVISSFEESCRLVTQKSKKTPPWWHDELRTLRNDANRLTRRWRRNPTRENHEAKAAASRSFKREVRRAKRESWSQFCSEVETLPATSRLHKILKRGTPIQQGTMKKPDGGFTVTPEETMKVLLDTHFPDLGAGEEGGPDHLVADHEIRNMDLHSLTVTEERVKTALLSFAPYKAPGPDGVAPVLLHRGMDLLLKHVGTLYLACLGIGYVPRSWQRTRVVFLPKPGKDDYSEAKSYRPITLANFFLKGLERLVYWYLLEGPLKEFPLHDRQYAYKAGVSTEDALHALVERLEKAVFNRQIAISVFLDIEGAFSNALTRSMVRGLQDHGTNPSVVRWVAYMLSHRTAETQLLGENAVKQVVKGCPQGGVLSPLLWNLIMDSLLEVLQGTVAVMGQAFADDVTAVSSGPDPAVVGNRLQRALDALDRWSMRHGLRFCAGKTEVVMFTRRRVGTPILRLGGQQLAFSKRVKYLGVVLDSQLSWLPHVRTTTRRAINSLAQCRRAVGSTWGLSPKTMHWLYTTAIRPILEYGCVIWCPGLQLLTAQRLLSKVQRAACLAATSAYPGTPTAALETFLNLPPLHEHLRGVATRVAHRMSVRGGWRGYRNFVGSQKSHIDVGNRLLQDEETLVFPTDWCPAVPNFSSPFRVIIPDRDDFNPETSELEVVEQPGKLHCFTDGSKMESGTGAGIVIRGRDLSEERSIPLGTYPTVFQAELTAISELTVWLRNLGITDHDITIYSDSQSALEALAAKFIRSSTVKNCRDGLISLSQDNQVTVSWIPGHSGLAGNELADQQAREGSGSTFIGPQPALPLSLQIIRRKIREKVATRHKTHWKNLTTCRQSRMFCTEPSAARSRDILRLSRKESRWVIQIMSGHANLARHRHLCGKAVSPMCPCGQEEETAFHHVAKCHRYNFARYQSFYRHQLEEDDLPRIHARTLASYLKMTKRLENFLEVGR